MIFTLTTIVFYYLLSFSSSLVKADTCDTYKHSQYGIGLCIDQSECPNSLYVSGLCESHSSNIQCCFSSNNTTNEEFRAVWIATVDNIDWPSSNTATSAQQQAELIQILNVVQRLNMNVVIFHVIRKKNRYLFLITNKYILVPTGSSSW